MTHQYGLQFRPAYLGTVPRDLEYSISASDLEPEHVRQRACHGILCTDRALTQAECMAFELVPILRTDADLESTVANVSSSCAEHATAYLARPAQLASSVANLSRLSPDGVHQCIADPARLLAFVTERLQSL